jgi:hypothetical protein
VLTSILTLITAVLAGDSCSRLRIGKKMRGQLHICLAEDRRSSEPAIKLLLSSLARYSPDIPVSLFYPPATDEFLAWSRALKSKPTVHTTPISTACGWNIKPDVVMKLLDEGSEQVIWLDSDVLLTRDLAPVFEQMRSDILVLSEEALLVQNEIDGLRARLWGYDVARRFQFPLNTAVMRVTQDHTALVKRWKQVLETTEYKDAQRRPVQQRPIHMVGDQDVLTALLSSKEFHDIPVEVLRRGTGIIQYFGSTGFTTAERVSCIIRGMPTFVHAQGGKPWIALKREKQIGLHNKLQEVYEDLSPYIVVAEALSFSQVSRMRPRTKLGSLLKKTGFGYAPFVGLPLAIAFDIERNIRRLAKNLLNRLCPDVIFAMRARRSRRYFRDAFLSRQSRVKSTIYGDTDPVVLSGPFSGMKYLNEVCWGPIEPKWLGSYEQELQDVVGFILKNNYSRVVDVGSAEGYYAVGFAISFPSAQVYSYDIDPWARRQQRRLAELNGVKNLSIRKLCTNRELQTHLSSHALLICDIEGSEYELLNPLQTPSLRKCDILVELHDNLDAGLTIKSGADELTRRFSDSHKVVKLGVSPRSNSKFRTLVATNLTDQQLTESMDERRSPDQVWLWLVALKRPINTPEFGNCTT